MSTRLCAYENNGVRCKNWITSSDDEITLCPLHGGVMKRELSPTEQANQRRFDDHVAFVEAMTDEELIKHQLQLESLLEDVKLRQQATAHVKSRRIKAISASNGELTDQQKAEIATLRGQKPKASQQTTKLSKEEKSIQNMMKLGFTREKAITLLGLDE